MFCCVFFFNVLSPFAKKEYWEENVEDDESLVKTEVKLVMHTDPFNWCSVQWKMGKKYLCVSEDLCGHCYNVSHSLGHKARMLECTSCSPVFPAALPGEK